MASVILLQREAAAFHLPRRLLRQCPSLQEANSIYREYEWSYEGSTWTWTLTIPRDLYDYFRGLPRPHCYEKDCDYSVLVTNTHDDSYIQSLVAKIREATAQKGYSEWETINFAVAFVQKLPYTYDNVTTPYDNYPRYAIETLADNGGDCEDTAVLMAKILDKMGYGVILIYDPGLHYAVGVMGSEGVSGTYFSYDGGKYYYLETTGTGWKIGQKPARYKGWMPTCMMSFPKRNCRYLPGAGTRRIVIHIHLLCLLQTEVLPRRAAFIFKPVLMLGIIRGGIGRLARHRMWSQEAV
jgi:hypothetical protein